MQPADSVYSVRVIKYIHNSYPF